MLSRFRPHLRIVLATTLSLITVLALALVYFRATPSVRAAEHARIHCEDNAATCTEVLDSLNYEGHYTGHDEPSTLFYSSVPGSGNSNIYQLTLPTDPPTLPNQTGTGGTWNFQLHPAFWFGMAMCDTQSAPNPGNITTCAPDSDTNIADNANPQANKYIGNHPGTAFMEMQFYPPSWAPWPAGNSCDATKWCAALNIDSLTTNLVTGHDNNPDCVNNVTGIEPVNFAFITKSGTPQPGSPPNPVDSTLATFTPNPAADLFMNSGDKLTVDMHDTAHGLQIVITDNTTGQVGSMTASAANDFGQVKWDPNPSATCANIPADFHPMYSTSSEHTRVPWAAHSYNVAFSDEIGHFEYCNATAGGGRRCTVDGVHDTDATHSGAEDDFGCFNAADSTRVPLIGCQRTDADFDGPEYLNTWPGSPGATAATVSTPILFTSPLFTGPGNSGLWNYHRVAFEADLPRIEGDTIPTCQRHVLNPADPNPGQGCVNPPAGASFYPFFTTGTSDGVCVWQEGGANIPGTTNTFGGSSTTAFGPLLLLTYPDPNPSGITQRFNNFRNILDHNPCPAPGGNNGGS
jgi:hypothetical protein